MSAAPTGGWRSLALPGAAALVAFAILLALGFWQLQRLAWKEALTAQVTARLAAPPIPAPPPGDWPQLDLAGLEYQPVTVTGTFADRQEVYVAFTQTRPKGPYGGIGYLVMTPLLTPDGWTVYVNRGFVLEDRRYPNQRPEGNSDGPVTVTGLMRQPVARPWYVPSDGISDNVWFSRDPVLFSEAYGAPSGIIAPYIIDALYDPDVPGGLPQGGTTLVEFPNSHLGYAITWFGLALALVGVFVTYARARLRPPAQNGMSDGNDGIN